MKEFQTKKYGYGEIMDLRTCKNWLEAKYIIEALIARKFNISAMTIRKMKGEDLTQYVNDFIENGVEFRNSLFQHLPDNVKKATLCKDYFALIGAEETVNYWFINGFLLPSQKN